MVASIIREQRMAGPADATSEEDRRDPSQQKPQSLPVAGQTAGRVVDVAHPGECFESGGCPGCRSIGRVGRPPRAGHPERDQVEVRHPRHQQNDAQDGRRPATAQQPKVTASRPGRCYLYNSQTGKERHQQVLPAEQGEHGEPVFHTDALRRQAYACRSASHSHLHS